MILVSHPTGNTFVRALLDELERAGLLRAFFTTLALHPDDRALQILPARLRAQALRRAYEVPAAKLHRFPLREWARHAAPRLGLSRLARHERGPASIDAVYRDLDRRVAAWVRAETGSLTGVYCYEDGALRTFEAAHKRGLARFYELPIAYWETAATLLAQEARRYPAWEPTLVATRDSPAKLARKTRELQLAQTIVVPSQFVLDSLPAWAREKPCVVAPFGSPASPEIPRTPAAQPSRESAQPSRKSAQPSRKSAQPSRESAQSSREFAQSSRELAQSSRELAQSSREAAQSSRELARSSRELARSSRELARSSRERAQLSRERAEARPLRVLFAGSMTQRKGLADLFAAIEMLGRADVELVVLGAPVAPPEFYRAQGVPFRYEAPRPHARVLELMASCDVLALPSIVEGRALVQQEALACGLPLLVTPNAGGQDLIVEGETGWLVPIRAPEILAQRIGWLADNRAVLPAMHAAARRKAGEYSWENYARIIVSALGSE